MNDIWPLINEWHLTSNLWMTSDLQLINAVGPTMSQTNEWNLTSKAPIPMKYLYVLGWIVPGSLSLLPCNPQVYGRFTLQVNNNFNFSPPPRLPMKDVENIRFFHFKIWRGSNVYERSLEDIDSIIHQFYTFFHFFLKV